MHTPSELSTVPALAAERWNIEITTQVQRFLTPGWRYDTPAKDACPECNGELHLLRRPNSGAQDVELLALICPSCPEAFSYADLRFLQRSTKPTRNPSAGSPACSPSVPTPRAPAHEPAPWSWACPSGPGVKVVKVTHPSQVRSLLNGTAPDSPGTRGTTPKIPAPVWDPRRLTFSKVADFADEPAQPSPEAELRMIMPEDSRFDAAAAQAEDRGAVVRRVRHWLEHESVTSLDEAGEHAALSARNRPLARLGGFLPPPAPRVGADALAALDAFDLTWASLDPPAEPAPPSVPADQLLPPDFLPYIPHPLLNPAQSEIIPHILDETRHLVAVAPTGAGKTTLGKVACLKAILERGGRAAWLVPQRSLTDELNRDLQPWRELGMRVERFSGEYAVEAEKLRLADLWVATTEKFEALCRTAWLRDAIEGVVTLVVDEIHLLGDTERGPVLEALLARVRQDAESVRIVGLSATVSNAQELADWLDARLAKTTWRPTRQVWQLPTIPATGDDKAASGARATLCTDLTARFTAEGGSVLVFAGSKRTLRTTALEIAASRGVPTHRIDPDDTDRVYAACDRARVGLHYRGWERNERSELAFRDRTYDVLVATSTVAAGVNLPARAVIVRDTKVGIDPIGVGTVLQMFGRAGRIGAGETEGWAFLIVDEAERPKWQRKLVDGLTVHSRIGAALPDHVLAEVVQGRFTTLRGARTWWGETLAFHQGDRDLGVVDDSIAFLADAGYLRAEPTGPDDANLTATDLGIVTTRMMIPTETGEALRSVLAGIDVPEAAREAELYLSAALATTVPDLAQAPVPENLRALVHRIVRDVDATREARTSAGVLARRGTGLTGGGSSCQSGDLAIVAFRLLIDQPSQFADTARGKHVLGISKTVIYPLFEEAPRYLGWLSAIGRLGAVHPWVAVVAGDLGRRIRWRGLGPRRGAGRLLAILEQMATSAHCRHRVPAWWKAARLRGITAPDWPAGAAPHGCVLPPDEYMKLLRERTTGTQITHGPDALAVTAPSGVIVTWQGTTYTAPIAVSDKPVNATYAHGESDAIGAAVFTRRGDHRASGWLEAYTSMDEQ